MELQSTAVLTRLPLRMVLNSASLPARPVETLGTTDGHPGPERPTGAFEGTGADARIVPLPVCPVSKDESQAFITTCWTPQERLKQSSQHAALPRSASIIHHTRCGTPMKRIKWSSKHVALPMRELFFHIDFTRSFNPQKRPNRLPQYVALSRDGFMIHYRMSHSQGSI